jgi:hypothetical protein
MSINRLQYENAAQLYLRQNPKSFERYYSPTLLKTLVDAMLSSLPTTVAAGIAFNRLVANGSLQRTDGKTINDDRLEAVSAAQANLSAVIAEVDAKPLSKDELAYFASLSQRELSQLYYGEDGRALDEFSIRYRRAAREHMFRLPERIRSAEAAAETSEIELTPEQYHSMPSAEMKVKMRDPKFKQQIYVLLKSGKI